MTTPIDAVQMPPLPDDYISLPSSRAQGFVNYYTTDQMHAYAQAHAAQPSAVVQEPVYHLRRYGDVTEAEMAKYMATGAIGKVKPTPPPVAGDTERLLLTFDEIQACLEALQYEHNEDDFEPECPSCTAHVKLKAAIAAGGKS